MNTKQFDSAQETIAAIATPMGQAGIGIIRISGPLSRGIAEKIFRPSRRIAELQSHRLYLGQLVDPCTDTAIDEVLLSFMQAPHSYTREDVVEINSHSGHLLLSTILQVVMDQGARLARPGEFTLRAFLNGRIDLTQAEAVANLIHSQSERGLQLASRQVRGFFRQEIETLRQHVVDNLARMEVAIDFPDEETGAVAGQEMVRRLREQVIKPVEKLIEAHAGAKIWMEGIHTVICGRVNAGKSSLLNRLSNEQKAIVTPIPGTTRDAISSTISIKGVPFHLWDTAGFDHGEDEVERIGVRLAEQKLAESEFVLIVVDQSRPFSQVDLDMIHRAEGKKGILVFNKIDLPAYVEQTIGQNALPMIRISALTGEGLDELKNTMVRCIFESKTDLADLQGVPNLRHKKALSDAAFSFQNAVRALEECLPAEIVAEELKNGLDALGEIIGETTNETVLDSIFSQFCLGK